ncbi:MAG: DUF3368 domain-containing protein [Gammaproteobacteria bacterium]|nr:DUF3368 domain-containing protein [Gammaproteobacteria bacterium]
MSVVSNTSPIINLAAVGKLELLHQLYGDIVISQAVYKEIMHPGIEAPGAREVENLSWITRHTVQNQALLISLKWQLDAGEAEAIVCALETGADLLLIDERRGNRVASNFGVSCAGILGVLLEAKHRNLLSAVQPVMDQLIRRADFWLTDDLYRHILQAAGE